MTQIVTVIMSGGSGTRLWPLSTPSAPKQFHALGTERTLIQETALRLKAPEFTDRLVICGQAHKDIASAQLKAVGADAAAIVIEPMARNTAAVAAIAALEVQRRNPDALVLLLPADHVIAKPESFSEAILKSAKVAQDHIVTFGIRPTHAETGYGYIERGSALSEGVFEIKRFLEKPDAATAQAYVDDGHFDWNAGIFLFAPDVMLDELQIHAPDVLNAARKSLEAARSEGLFISLDAHEFARVPSISIDYAVMERTNRAAVTPCDIGWADVGSFEALWRIGAKDSDGNHIHGKGFMIESANNLVHSPALPVALIGVENLMVIVSEDGVLVAPLARAQDVKLAAEAAKASKLSPTSSK